MAQDYEVEKVKASVDPQELVAIVTDLIRADSENPPGNEQRAAEVAAGWLEKIGCAPIEFHAEIPGRPSIIAWWPGDSHLRDPRGKILALNGHLDVVPAGDPKAWKYPPFSGQVEDGRIYGRGASDMKSGIASMIGAVSAMRRAGIVLGGSICFQFVADEESAGTHGTEYLLRKGSIRADAAIVGEPTSLMVGIGERGALWAKIKAFGRAAHGSVPQAGVSAIQLISKAVVNLHGRDFGHQDPLFGTPTLNVGVISGGEKVNIVADYAEAHIDRRLIPGETAESALSEIDQILSSIAPVKSAGSQARPGHFEVEVMKVAEPSVEPKDSEIVQALSASIEDCIGGPAEFYVSPGSSDARFLRNQAGIPTVLFGPGIMGLAHVQDEYVELDSMVAAAEVIAATAIRFLTE